MATIAVLWKTNMSVAAYTSLRRTRESLAARAEGAGANAYFILRALARALTLHCRGYRSISWEQVNGRGNNRILTSAMGFRLPTAAANLKSLCEQPPRLFH